MDWNKIIGARNLIRSGFYSDPRICSWIVDRCLTSILLDATTSDPEGSPMSQDECESALPLLR